MNYIRSLDGVRAVAILIVMLFHFNYILEIGWIGVQLFFVLSGFLITTILLEAKEKSNSFGNYLKVFYWRRTLRIFPLYYFYLLVIFLFFLVFEKPDDFTSLIPFLLSYSYNYYPLFNGFEFDYFFTHFWSLCVEEQFYLIWPFIIYLLNKKHLKILLFLIICLTPIFRYSIGEFIIDHNIVTDDIGEVIYRLLPSQIDSLAFGALIPIFSLHKRNLPYSRLLVISTVTFLILGLINWVSIRDVCEIGITSIGFPIASMHNYAHVWSYSIIGGLSTILILYLISTSKKNLLTMLLSSEIFVRIGKVSYGMYLYHLILIPFYQRSIGIYVSSELISFILYLLITYLVSLISYRFFEEKFIKLKDRLVL